MIVAFCINKENEAPFIYLAQVQVKTSPPIYMCLLWNFSHCICSPEEGWLQLMIPFCAYFCVFKERNEATKIHLWSEGTFPWGHTDARGKMCFTETGMVCPHFESV